MLTIQLEKALYNCCQPDKALTYDNLKGLLHTEGKIVASDTHVLAAVTCEYDPALENIITNRSGEDIKLEYPRWKGVLPANPSEFILGPSFTDLATACKNLKRGKTNNPLFIDLRSIPFNPAVILRIVAVFNALEETPTVSIRNNAPLDCWTNNRAMLKSENCIAIICSVKHSPEMTFVSVPDAIKVGDLL